MLKILSRKVQLHQPEVIINLGSLRRNYRYIQDKVGSTKVMAVVKGNAYVFLYVKDDYHEYRNGIGIP